MIKLRSRASRQKSWADTSKLLNITLKDKKLQSSREERTLLREHLQKLVRIARANSAQGVKERLESVAMELGLRYSDKQYPSHHVAVIATDHFHVEFRLDTSGRTMDAIVAHGSNSSSSTNQPTSCPEISQALNDCKLETVKEHVRGLTAMYAIGADQNRCKRAFIALQAMENDLNEMAQNCSSSEIRTVTDTIHKAPLGILYPRSGGCPLKILYFVGPYDLLNEKTKTSLMITDVKAMNEHCCGQYVTVSIEGASPRKLQHQSLIINSSPNEYDMSALDNQNSSVLPAVFYLNLHKPMLITRNILKEIQKFTEIDISMGYGESGPLVSLLIKECAKNDRDSTSNIYPCGVAINLPDQQHAYFFNGGSSESLHAVRIQKIPFTHPTHVPAIIAYLRTQALFNSVLASCVRSGRVVKDRMLKEEGRNVFQTTVISLKHISVSYENPNARRICSAEFKLNNATCVECFLRCGSVLDDGKSSGADGHLAAKVFKRSQSIPVTMRVVSNQTSKLKDRYQEMTNSKLICEPDKPNPQVSQLSYFEGFASASLDISTNNISPPVQATCPPPRPRPLGQQISTTGTNLSVSSLGMTQIEPTRSLMRSASTTVEAGQQGSIHGGIHRTISDPGRADSEVSKCTMLARLLDPNTSSPETEQDNSALTSNYNSLSSKIRKPASRKRKNDQQIRVGRSPKRKVSGDEFDFEISSRNTPTVGHLANDERPPSARSLPDDHRPLSRPPSRPPSASEQLTNHPSSSPCLPIVREQTSLAELLQMPTSHQSNCSSSLNTILATQPSSKQFTDITDLVSPGSSNIGNYEKNNHTLTQFHQNYQHKPNITVKLKIGKESPNNNVEAIEDSTQETSCSSNDILNEGNDIRKSIERKKSKTNNEIKRKRSDIEKKSSKKKSDDWSKGQDNEQAASVKITIGGKLQFKKLSSNKPLVQKSTKTDKHKLSKSKSISRSKSETEAKKSHHFKSLTTLSGGSSNNGSPPTSSTVPQSTSVNRQTPTAFQTMQQQQPLSTVTKNAKAVHKKKSLSEVISKLHPTSSTVETKLSAKDEMEKIRKEMIMAGNNNANVTPAKLGPIPKKAPTATANKISNNQGGNRLRPTLKSQHKSPASPSPTPTLSIKDLSQDEAAAINLPTPKIIPLDKVSNVTGGASVSPDSSDADSPGASLVIDTSQTTTEISPASSHCR
ncbi:DgyrCDS6034 [Dimorphilus gyrociliatus]|uniref:Mediator of RNA polymerase II transcription subunit 1 n=1 Tax=Dimorphilus gyrociliatus TaxID=2664684 RepID=A0A7I8VP46_9ANNE|nr:DgyrCDS6034 [Dimorphilus gyrociliatus]